MEDLDLIYQVDRDGFVPEKAHETDAGFDIRTPEFLIVPAKSRVFVDSKVRVLVPNGYVGMLKSKSGLNKKKGVTTTGTIDAGYTGTIGVTIYNNSDSDVFFERGDKITQLVVLPIPTVKLVEGDVVNYTSERGEGGFGSTGK